MSDKATIIELEGLPFEITTEKTMVYETIMREYEYEYFCLQGRDGIYVLVNSEAYNQMKHGGNRDRENVTIQPHSLDGKLLSVIMINGTAKKWGNRKRKLQKILSENDCESMIWDDSHEGGVMVFPSRLLSKIAPVYAIRRRVQLSDDQRRKLSERMTKMVAA